MTCPYSFAVPQCGHRGTKSGVCTAIVFSFDGFEESVRGSFARGLASSVFVSIPSALMLELTAVELASVDGVPLRLRAAASMLIVR